MFSFALFLSFFVSYKVLARGLSDIEGNCEPNTDFDTWNSLSPDSNSGWNLEQSHVLIRHGSRTVAYE